MFVFFSYQEQYLPKHIFPYTAYIASEHFGFYFAVCNKAEFSSALKAKKNNTTFAITNTTRTTVLVHETVHFNNTIRGGNTKYSIGFVVCLNFLSSSSCARVANRLKIFFQLWSYGKFQILCLLSPVSCNRLGNTDETFGIWTF